MNECLKKGVRLHGGKYTIDRVLGQGSFGITYLAKMLYKTQTDLGEMEIEGRVCIKEFFMSEVNNRHNNGTSVEGSKGTIFTNYRRKFRVEAENLFHLKHPNIVKVYDVFDENNTTYYVMEYVEGQNLDEYIAGNAIGDDEFLNIASQVGRALDYMHSQRMLHLDLKPKNIMRRDDGHCFIIDFGLSKQYNAQGEPESSTTLGLGTPGYAPIEQAHYRQDGTFPATLDVYAFGATLYKLLTGQRPPDATVVFDEGLEGFAPSNKLFADVVRRAMAPSRKSRYQTVRQMLTALNCDDGTELPPPIPPQPKKKTAPKKPAPKKPVPKTPVPKTPVPKTETQQPVNASQDSSPSVWSRLNLGAAVLIALGGMVMIALMEDYVQMGKYSFSSLDGDGEELAAGFAILSVIGAVLTLTVPTRRIPAERYTRLRIAAIVLFVMNTALLPMWNYSLTASYLVLSIGLLVITTLLFLLSPKPEWDK